MTGRDQPVVLIAEDDENDIAMLRRAFRQASITAPIQYITDGEQAIAYLKGEGKFARRDEFPLPDLLLLDLKMPRKSGFDVLEWLRTQPPLSHLRVVVLTTSEDLRDVNRAYALGAASFLTKPVNFVEFKDTIQAMYNYWAAFNRKPQIERPPLWNPLLKKDNEDLDPVGCPTDSIGLFTPVANQVRQSPCSALLVTDGRLVPVLLIDDDENDVVLFRRALLATGAKVRLTTLDSGQAAVDYLHGVNGYSDRAQHPLPHLIFLDAHLPGISGSQVLQTIKSNIALSPIPVIVLTGAISPNETLALYRSGANAICLKPLTAGQLESFTSLVCRFWIDTVVPPSTGTTV